MTRFYCWLRLITFDLSEWFSRKAIGKRAIKAYQRALINHDVHSVDAAIKELLKAYFLLPKKSFERDTVMRMQYQMQKLRHELTSTETNLKV